MLVQVQLFGTGTWNALEKRQKHDEQVGIKIRKFYYLCRDYSKVIEILKMFPLITYNKFEIKQTITFFTP